LNKESFSENKTASSLFLKTFYGINSYTVMPVEQQLQEQQEV